MLFTRSGKYLAWLQSDSREADTLKSWPLFLFVSLSLPAIGQSSAGTPQDRQAGHVQLYTSLEQEPDDLRQELDADAAALSKIPADPLLQPDPLGFLFMGGHHLEGLVLLQPRERPPSKKKSWAWPRYTRLNGVEICLGSHSSTPNRPVPANTMKVWSSPFTGFG